MIFHCLAVPHTITSRKYAACAYTGKVLKFIEMMTARGHECIHYGHPDSEVECENVEVVSRETFNECYGREKITEFFEFSLADKAYIEAQQRAIVEIGKRRKSRNEFILSFFSVAGQPVCQAHPGLINVEPGIGYAEGHFAPYKVFESYALFHAYYGLENSSQAKMDWNSCVIPNYFDHKDFEYRDGGDYILFLGRIYEGKGVHLVIQAAEKCPHLKFKIAGQNRSYVDDNYGPGKQRPLPDNIEVVGFADRDLRRELYRDASAVMCLTKYVEPFGGVAIEAMLSGTPVISTDWGAFTETILHGVTGYRVRSFEQILWALRNVSDIDPAKCRAWAYDNYTYGPIAKRYEEYFSLLLQLHADPARGWYAERDDRTELDHLTYTYPTHLN